MWWRGRLTPSGRLAVSWAKKYSDIPYADEFYAPEGKADNAVYKEGIYVGYRYFDSFGQAPRYEFGYGLSYTDFAVTPKKVSLEKGEYLLRIGTSSRKTKVCAAVRMREDVVTAKHRNICPPSVPVKEPEPPEIRQEKLADGLPWLEAKPEDFTCRHYQYDETPVCRDFETDTLMEKLTQKDMINLVVGAGTSDGGRWFKAPGAAGSK